ncbi:plasmid partitioning/stability family protein [Escherichia coli]|uniref:plasmid partitioning/stability family protein n=1 Tax=Escherichia coli TaxID=562 RepID=UPI0011B576D4|nr:plasmid partitioning/stability family protein [Escherichia coli]
MRGPTRRISFYLKPEVVKNEKKACDYLDSLPTSERSRAQRAAFLAGLALIKRNPAFAHWLAEWPKEETMPACSCIQNGQNSAPAVSNSHSTGLIKNNIKTFFPE